MMTFASYFWPAIWSMIGIGAAVTVAACLVIAIVPIPNLRSHASRPAGLGRPRHLGVRPAHHAHA